MLLGAVQDVVELRDGVAAFDTDGHGLGRGAWGAEVLSCHFCRRRIEAA
jgi:hypothetical protein